VPTPEVHTEDGLDTAPVGIPAELVDESDPDTVVLNW
jgi:hypothetical protein